MESILDSIEMQELIEEYGEDKIKSILRKRKKFFLFFDNLTCINKLSNEQTGILFKNIIAYESMKEMEKMDSFVEFAFSFIEPRLINGLVEYVKESITNAKNGSKGGKAKAEKYKQEKEEFIIPTKNEFIQFCSNNNRDKQNAELWFNEFDKSEWRYAGKLIEDWKALALEKVK